MEPQRVTSEGLQQGLLQAISPPPQLLSPPSQATYEQVPLVGHSIMHCAPPVQEIFVQSLVVELQTVVQSALSRQMTSQFPESPEQEILQLASPSQVR